MCSSEVSAVVVHWLKVFSRLPVASLFQFNRVSCSFNEGYVIITSEKGFTQAHCRCLVLLWGELWHSTGVGLVSTCFLWWGVLGQEEQEGVKRINCVIRHMETSFFVAPLVQAAGSDTVCMGRGEEICLYCCLISLLARTLVLVLWILVPFAYIGVRSFSFTASHTVNVFFYWTPIQHPKL